MIGDQDLFAVFLEDAARLARALRERPTLADAYALATSALGIGVVELGLLADAVARTLAAGDTARAAPAIAAIERAVAELAGSDASGARLDPTPLAAARAALTEAATPPVAETTSVLWTPAVPDDMLDLFFEEAHDRLEGLAQKLISLETRPADGELVRDIFRDLHTLKGSSAMVGLAPMNRLAHAAEDLVGQLRDGKRAADRPAVDALLGALDGLRAIAERAAARAAIDVDTAPLIARLRAPHAAAAPVEPAAPAAAAAAAAPAAGRATLRVDFDKLDLLLNLVGELVLGKAALGAAISGLGSLGRELEADRRLAVRAGRAAPGKSEAANRALAEELGRVERVFHELGDDLSTSSARLDRVSAELREQVMKLRMVPIAGVFRKHQRTARDLAHRLGKDARLELAGEDTELDKVLVEQLDDPLMHLVRNAIDHGVESPAARAAAGKPAQATVRLEASHRGNGIVVTVRDDGGGIDPARLRAKALEKGVATREELDALDDTQVLDLIFRPGFSTAAKVSDVSGRGVGLDVVRETIVNRLKGTVEISSEIGRGTVFTLRLPLTLAIIPVLLVGAAGEVFAIPLDVVRRTQAVSPADIHRVHEREVLAVRERDEDGVRQVPLVRVRDVLALPGDGDGASQVILVETQGGRFGLLCDRLLGKQDAVIKSLGALLEDVPCAAGATLLGDRPALILDVPALVTRAAAPRVRTEVPVVTQGAARRHILLVEDSDTARATMQRTLEAAGYQVTAARDGAEALAIVERAERPFDLVSTDVMMPNLDGYQLSRALRAHPRHHATPIVMVTGRGERIDRVRGFDAGVDEYLTKPHDPQDLLNAVARHLKKGEA